MKKFFKLLLGVLAFTPALALAGPFDPPSTDISVAILNQLFGGLLTKGHDAFGGAILTFNSAVLAIGGILAAYTILAGTLGTAHDGEMLGKKFSSVWLPIRYALGTALVLPVLPGGYCIMQQIVMWLVVQGIGLADIVWESYLDVPPITLNSKMNFSTKKEIQIFAENVALAQACTQVSAAVMNDGTGKGGGIINIVVRPLGSYKYGVIADSNNKNQFLFGDQGGKFTLLTSTVCGIANLPPVPAETVKDMLGGSRSSTGGKLGDISSAFKIPATTPIYQAHWDSGKKLIDNLGKVAAVAAEAQTPIEYAEVQKAADEYIKTVQKASDAYIKSGDPFSAIKTASKQQGWILAGAWYTKLTMLNKQISSSVNTAPTASGVMSLGQIFGVKWLDSINPRVGTLQQNILYHKGERFIEESAESASATAKQARESGDNFLAKITSKITEFATGIDMGNLQNDTRPAIIIIQEAGENLLALWANMMTAMATVGLVLGIKVLGSGVDLNPAVTTIIGFLVAPIAALVAIGFTLAYMLPNLPFLMWIGVVLGWLIMVIEAILAAPLWAVMHLHPNGDDMTGKGANGYMLILGLTLRPVLTIFGLIAALAVTDLMGEFVNKIFFSVFFTGNMTGWIAILGIVFGMGVYCMAMFSLFKKTFSLMHVIPDQLLRWIGGGGEQLGQYAGSVADGAGKGIGAATAVAGFIGKDAISNIGNAAGQNQQFKLKQAELKSTEDKNKNANDAVSPGAGDSLAESREAGYAANGEAAPEISGAGSLMTFGNNQKFAKDNMAEQNVTGALKKIASTEGAGPPAVQQFLNELSASANDGYKGFKGDTTAQKRVNAAHQIAGDILNSLPSNEKTIHEELPSSTPEDTTTKNLNSGHHSIQNDQMSDQNIEKSARDTAASNKIVEAGNTPDAEKPF